MARSDTSAIDQALLARLAGDATLTALVPDGIHWDLAPAGSLAFGIVSRGEQGDSYTMPGHGRERVVYLVKAVTSGPSRAAATQAAQRIYELLQDAPLAPTGYGLTVCQRLEAVPDHTEIDEVTDARWQHVGGQYEVIASPVQ